MHETASSTARLWLNGRRVDLSRITQPMLVVAANQDFIVPAPCAQGLMDVVSSEDKEYVNSPAATISFSPVARLTRHSGPR